MPKGKGVTTWLVAAIAAFVGIVIFINLAVDLSYAALDPRIRR